MTKAQEFLKIIEAVAGYEHGESILLGPYANTADRKSDRTTLFNQKKKLTASHPELSESIKISGRKAASGELMIEVRKKNPIKVAAFAVTNDGKVKKVTFTEDSALPDLPLDDIPERIKKQMKEEGKEEE